MQLINDKFHFWIFAHWGRTKMVSAPPICCKLYFFLYVIVRVRSSSVGGGGMKMSMQHDKTEHDVKGLLT